VSSSTSRRAAALRRSASALTSARSWSAWTLACDTIWSAFLVALLTSCRACESASRRVWSACADAFAARCSAVEARCSASDTSFCVADWAAASRSASWRSDYSRRGARGGAEAFGFLALGLFAPRRELDLELGLGLGPLRLALLQDPLRLAAHLV